MHDAHHAASGSSRLSADELQRVPVTLGVMSRCPDALYCETIFDQVLLASAKQLLLHSGTFSQQQTAATTTVNDLVDLQLSFIGTPNSTASTGVECRHGEQECQGNVQELCFMHKLRSSPRSAAGRGEEYNLSPSAAQKTWWEYVQCLNYEGAGKIGQVALAKKCAGIVGGVEWEGEGGVAECVEGKEGKELLKKSIRNSRKLGIVNSCTILVENKPICIRDDNQWKNCTNGHDVGDFVKLIQAAYDRRNGLDLSASAVLPVQQIDPAQQQMLIFQKRDVPAAATPVVYRRQSFNTTTALGAPSSTMTDPNASQTNAPPGGGLSLFGGNNNGQPANPASVFTFVIAIALFIVVVCFVLLRIFLRNRRLRRLGLFVDDDFLGGRGAGLLSTHGGMFGGRFAEDPLQPPKLWDAKIADIGKLNATTGAGAGGQMGLVDEKEMATHTWDALMPVAAALPPNLYPILFDPDKGGAAIYGMPPQRNPTGAGGASALPARHVDQGSVDANEPAHRRLARRVPRLFRRGPSAGPASGETPAAAVDAPLTAAGGVEDAVEQVGGEDEQEVEKEKEDPDAQTPTAASVNITVLIAMPSSKTVFPSQRRLNGQVSASTLRSPYLRHAASNLPKGVAEEIEEDAEGGASQQQQEAEREKGKMRRAPSLRSVRTVASSRSVAEARREAFFASQQAEAAAEDDGASKRSAPPMPMPMPHPLDGGLIEGEEEEELPELVFGTASVPILKRVVHAATASNSFYFQAQQQTASELVHPTKADLRQLLANAKTAQERKLQAEAERKKEADVKLNASASVVAVSATTGAGGASGGRESGGQEQHRSSSQEEGEEGRASVASSGAHALGLGDVVHRMMQPHRAGEENAIRARATSPAVAGDDTTDGGHTAAHVARSSFGPSFDINRTTGNDAAGLGLQDEHPLQSQISLPSMQTRDGTPHEERRQQQQAEPRRALLA